MEQCNLLHELEKIETLPTLPVVAQKALKLISNRRSNMAQIAAVISRDQAIAARVVRLVNSAFYGLRERVSSIQHAIVILGLNTVKNLVLGVSVVRTFEECGQVSIFDREKFWLHSFACAQGARLIAQELKREEPEDYFLAGLLHDIGILIIDQFFHPEFIEILQQSLIEEGGYLSSEKRILGLDHGAVGEYLAKTWKIPPYLAHSIRFHHLPKGVSEEAVQSLDYIRITSISDAKSLHMNIGAFTEKYGTTFDSETARALGITEEKIDTVFEKVASEVDALIREWGL